jgi:predicted DNA-binding protein with PD1-like motif
VTSIGVHRSHKARYLVLRVPDGEAIPGALAAALQDEGVTCGWLSGGGVLTDVELRAYSAEIGTLGNARRIDGPVHVLALEGSIGLAGGELSVSLRAMLGRETDRGLETLSGEIASARSVALELFVTALEDVTLERSLDEAAGIWMLGPAGEVDPERPPVSRPPAPAAPAAWSAALEASDRPERDPRPRSGTSAGAHGGSGGHGSRPRANGPAVVPMRPPRPESDSVDTPYPEKGDSVDHFAFGRCDVVKSDGDRLHLKIHKDGRVREIALAMLRVSRLADAEDGRRRFKLERRI